MIKPNIYYKVSLIETTGDASQDLPYMEFGIAAEIALRLQRFSHGHDFTVHLYKITESWSETDTDGVPINQQYSVNEVTV
jgi:hypothetical protein